MDGPCCLGIDEAGFGPLLGPLAVVSVAVGAADPGAARKALRRAPLGIRDSKLLHRPGDLAPLESVALPAVAWLTGWMPATAAELFALLGEREEDRAAVPWMAGAGELRLPCAARHCPGWSIDGVVPLGLDGALVHPRALNDAAAGGTNRAALELEHVGRLLRDRPGGRRDSHAAVDRLGGRRYYRAFLSTVWPGAAIETLAEEPACSAYRVDDDEARHEVRFTVDGERHSPLTALAGCIAKYARELHMRLHNRYWCGRYRWLRPTAGYAADARRWLFQLGDGNVRGWELDLVRLGAAVEAREPAS